MPPQHAATQAGTKCAGAAAGHRQARGGQLPKHSNRAGWTVTKATPALVVIGSWCPTGTYPTAVTNALYSQARKPPPGSVGWAELQTGRDSSAAAPSSGQSHLLDQAETVGIIDPHGLVGDDAPGAHSYNQNRRGCWIGCSTGRWSSTLSASPPARSPTAPTTSDAPPPAGAVTLHRSPSGQFCERDWGNFVERHHQAAHPFLGGRGGLTAPGPARIAAAERLRPTASRRRLLRRVGNRPRYAAHPAPSLRSTVVRPALDDWAMPPPDRITVEGGKGRQGPGHRGAARSKLRVMLQNCSPQLRSTETCSTRSSTPWPKRCGPPRNSLPGT